VLFFLFLHRSVLIAILPLILAASCLAADPNIYRPNDPLNQAAFQHYYNLDHDAAIQDFEHILARHPNDPFAVNHLLSAIQVRELYRMGAMNTGDYSNDNFIGIAHRPADPAQKQRIKQLVEPNWHATQMMSMRSTPAALRADSSPSIRLLSSAPGSPRFAMPSALVAITNAFSS
jgi:hypothetical protein